MLNSNEDRLTLNSKDEDHSLKPSGQDPRGYHGDGQQPCRHYQGQARHASQVLQAHPIGRQDAWQEEVLMLQIPRLSAVIDTHSVFLGCSPASPSMLHFSPPSEIRRRKARG